MIMSVIRSNSSKMIAAAGAASLIALALAYAQQRSEPPRAAEPPRSFEAPRAAEPPRTAQPQRAPEPQRAPIQQQRPVYVNRVSHGTVRHIEPSPAPPSAHMRPGGRISPHVIRPGDPNADFHRHWHWNDFAYGRRWGVLPVGCISVIVNGAPFYYDDGIYYQPSDGSYQEVYPPDGAVIPDLPDGAIEIDTPDQTYYYAGGAFYVQQDNGYVIVPAPIGVVVPELPPGAVQTPINGFAAWQFNGVYYEPVFVNGVTQYQTFQP